MGNGVALIGGMAGDLDAGANLAMLDTLLRAAGLWRKDCALVTNVLNLRGDTAEFFGSRSKGSAVFPPFHSGKYLLPEYEGELNRLYEALAGAEPRVIVTMGDLALWALCGVSDISRRRGAWHADEKVLATFRPSMVLQQYQWFPLVVSDLIKARQIAAGEIEPARFETIPRPTLEEVLDFCAGSRHASSPIVFDIETIPSFRAITCVGLGYDGRFMCVPLMDENSPACCYWPTAGDEAAAITAVKAALEYPGTAKLAHHSSYDLSWLYSVMGIRVGGQVYDTRMMHHSLAPELPHTLGSIGHTYFVLPPWKALRKAAKGDNE